MTEKIFDFSRKSAITHARLRVMQFQLSMLFFATSERAWFNGEIWPTTNYPAPSFLDAPTERNGRETTWKKDKYLRFLEIQHHQNHSYEIRVDNQEHCVLYTPLWLQQLEEEVGKYTLTCCISLFFELHCFKSHCFKRGVNYSYEWRLGFRIL